MARPSTGWNMSPTNSTAAELRCFRRSLGPYGIMLAMFTWRSLLLFCTAPALALVMSLPVAAADKAYTSTEGMEFVLIPAGTFEMG